MSTAEEGARVVVVGAGIAGLTAAFLLGQAGHRVTVLERGEHLGGRMRTVERDGFRIDVAASFLSSGYRAMRELFAETGLDSRVRPTCDTVGFVRDGRVHRVRSHALRDLLGTRLLGWRAKAALGAVRWDMHRHRRVLDFTDPSRAAGLDDEDIAAYARRRGVPPDVLRLLLEPLSMQFCLAEPGELSRVNLHFFLHLALGNGFFNAPGGVDFLPRALARGPGVEIELGAEAVRVETVRGGAVGAEHGRRGRGAVVTWRSREGGEHCERVDGIVLAVPGSQVPELHPQLSQDQRAFLRGLPYTKGVAVAVGLDRRPAEPAMWLTVPGNADGLVGLILDHNKAPGRVPEGAGLVSTFWHRDWHRRHYGMDDARIAEDAVRALTGVLPVAASEVRMVHVHRWDPYAVAWPTGSLRALREFLRGLDPDSPVQLAGDYFSFECTDSSLASGRRAAHRLIGALRG